MEPLKTPHPQPWRGTVHPDFRFKSAQISFAACAEYAKRCGSFSISISSLYGPQIQQTLILQALKRRGVKASTYRMSREKLAVVVESILHPEPPSRPKLSFFEPMVTRDPNDRQAAIRVLSDESAVLFWTLPQARLERFQDGDFPLRPRPEYLSLRRREYLSWLEAADQGTTVLWPLVVDTSWQPGRQRLNYTVNSQAQALHAIAKKMMLRIQTRLFDDDFLALRIRASQEA